MTRSELFSSSPQLGPAHRTRANSHGAPTTLPGQLANKISDPESKDLPSTSRRDIQSTTLRPRNLFTVCTHLDRSGDSFCGCFQLADTRVGQQSTLSDRTPRSANALSRPARERPRGDIKRTECRGAPRAACHCAARLFQRSRGAPRVPRAPRASKFNHRTG